MLPSLLLPLGITIPGGKDPLKRGTVSMPIQLCDLSAEPAIKEGAWVPFIRVVSVVAWIVCPPL